MSRAGQSEFCTDTAGSLEHGDDFLPHCKACVRFHVADEIHSMLSAAEKYIDTVDRLEKANFLFVVALYQ